MDKMVGPPAGRQGTCCCLCAVGLRGGGAQHQLHGLWLSGLAGQLHPGQLVRLDRHGPLLAEELPLHGKPVAGEPRVFEGVVTRRVSCHPRLFVLQGEEEGRERENKEQKGARSVSAC